MDKGPRAEITEGSVYQLLSYCKSQSNLSASTAVALIYRLSAGASKEQAALLQEDELPGEVGKEKVQPVDGCILNLCCSSLLETLVKGQD